MRDAAREVTLAVTSDTRVSALWRRPAQARWAFALAHGAGAGMRHPFLEAIAEELAARGIASLRYQFPYLEAGKKRPDRQDVLLRTVRAAVALAGELASDLPLIAGGKSMGGRMTSLAEASEPLPGLRGIVFLGFPLHPARRPAASRGEHLAAVTRPMLFLQGTRDALGDLALLAPLCDSLGQRATLATFAGADHGFHLPRRDPRGAESLWRELADTIARWLERCI